MKVRAMIVDDSWMEMENLVECVDWEALGIELCGKAKNGKKGLELFARERPDLVIADIQMPGMDGLEMTREIQKLDPDVSVVFLSNYREFEYARQAIALGVKEYIVKQDVESEKTQEIFRRLVREVTEKKDSGDERLHLMLEEYFRDPEAKAPEEFSADAACSLLVLFHDRQIPYAAVFPGIAKPEEERRSRWAHLFRTVFAEKDWYFLELTEQYSLILLRARKAPDAWWKELLLTGRRCLERFSELDGVQIRLAAIRTRGTLAQIREAYQRAKRLFFCRFFYAPETLLITEAEKFYAAGSRETPSQAALPERLTSSQAEQLLKESRLTEEIEKRAGLITQAQDVGEAQVLLQLLDSYGRMLWEEGRQKGVLSGEVTDGIREHAAAFAPMAVWLAQRLTEAFARLSGEAQLQYSPAVSGAITYIRRHLDDKQLDMNRTAQAVSLSPSRLRALFRREAGCSLSQYLTRLRLQKAEELLLQTCMKMDEIAEACGYLDGKYFRKVFQQKHGITPREYRMRKGCEHAADETDPG